MSQLFSPLRLGPLDLANRIAISPMCQYSAIHGDAQDWHMVHLGSLSMSGAGLLIVEASAVEPRGRITHGDLGIWSDDNVAALKRIVGFCRRNGSAKLGIQIAHAGRKGSAQAPWEGGRALHDEQDTWETIAPSALPFAEDWHTPKAATEAEIDGLVEAFAAATGRAVDLGFDLVEMHSAHGYLLHEFLSPLSNERTDAYGGSLENRMRFPLRVFEAMRTAAGDGVAVGARITGSDWIPGGIDVGEAIAFARELKARGCHYVDVSSGGLSLAAKIELGPGYQLGFAADIRKATGMPVMGVGLVVTPELAEHAVSSGQVDMVALGRTALDDPHWAWNAAQVLGGEVERPPQYLRAAPKVWPGAGYKHEERAAPRQAAE